MTGPEHYQSAELLLDMASDDECGDDAEIYHVAAAQVHATLALAAAQAIVPQLAADSGFADFEAWYEAAGVSKP